MRSNIICVGSGFKGSGKTRKTLEWVFASAFPASGKGRKALIIDTNQEYTPQAVREAGFSHPIKTMEFRNIHKFNVHPKIEVRRMLPVTPQGKLLTIKEKKELAWQALQHFRGGTIVLDDINSYVLNVTHEEDFVGTIMNNAHRNQDILINVQSINMLNPVLIRNLDFVRMHFQIDGIQDKFEDRQELYTIAKNIVDIKYSAGQKYFNVMIDNHKYLITGKFSKADFANACYKYVNQNTKLIKQQQLKLKTKDNVKAIAGAINELFRYNGNQ